MSWKIEFKLGYSDQWSPGYGRFAGEAEAKDCADHAADSSDGEITVFRVVQSADPVNSQWDANGHTFVSYENPQ